MPAFNTINNRIKIIQIVTETLQACNPLEVCKATESAAEPTAQPEFFNFKPYKDSTLVSYARNMQKRGVDLLKVRQPLAVAPQSQDDRQIVSKEVHRIIGMKTKSSEASSVD